jgi:hypothetical protein
MAFEFWGRIANPAFQYQRVKGSYFFAGDWWSKYNPIEFYGPPAPGANDGLYTVHPADGRHLGWSVLPENRRYTVAEMVRAGLNTAVMSYWGEAPGGPSSQIGFRSVAGLCTHAEFHRCPRPIVRRSGRSTASDHAVDREQ